MLKNKLKRRFKGFTDDWEQRKVGDTITEVSRPVELKDNELYQLVTVKRRNEGIVSRGKLLGKDILVKNYYEVCAGDYVISKRQLIHGANGVIPQELDKSVVSNEYMVCVSNDKITAEFLGWLSKTTGLKRDFFLSSYGVDVEKMVFNADDWKKRYLTIPSIDEQKKITSYLSNLDNLIVLRQRKLDKLTCLKKAYLSEMFPALGEKKPKRRFPGFSDDWEQRKLGDITSKIGSGKTPSGGAEAYVEAGTPLIRSQNVHDDMVDLSDVVFIDDETNKSMENSAVSTDDVLLNITGASIGRSAVYKGTIPANVNQHVCIIRPISGYYSDFLQLHIASANGQKQIDSSQAGGAREGLNFQQISKFEFAFPSFEEQVKIGDYIRGIDKLITLHQRKLDKLKLLKQAYLSEMFV